MSGLPACATQRGLGLLRSSYRPPPLLFPDPFPAGPLPSPLLLPTELCPTRRAFLPPLSALPGPPTRIHPFPAAQHQPGTLHRKSAFSAAGPYGSWFPGRSWWERAKLAAPRGGGCAPAVWKPKGTTLREQGGEVEPCLPGDLSSLAPRAKEGQTLVQDPTAIWGKARTSTQMCLPRRPRSAAILGGAGEGGGGVAGRQAGWLAGSLLPPPWVVLPSLGRTGSRPAEPWWEEACPGFFEAHTVEPWGSA